MSVKSEWKVQSNYISGVGTMYIAYRIRDISKVVHSGNIEHYGKYSANREEVEELVKQLNSQEEEK